MTGPERGFLLLACRLGNPERRILSTAQLRTLASRVQTLARPEDDRELTHRDLTGLGYGEEMAGRILALLAEDALLDRYLARAARAGCSPILRCSSHYPQVLRDRLGLAAPACLWALGDISLLRAPAVALVGSRDLLPPNGEFAAEAGLQAARQGFTLVSGNARGADRTAQSAALHAGGRVISIVADSLEEKQPRQGTVFLSEGDFDSPFSPQRALSRNRVIHALADKTLVAQCACQQGGTWDGTVKNLRFGFSPVFCYDDGSPAVALLTQMGATPISTDRLRDLRNLLPLQTSLL